MHRLILAFASFLLTTNVYALFCPTNFSSVDYGASVDQVVSQCGKPKELKQYKSYGNLAQQWTYFVKPNGYQNQTVKMNVLLSNNTVANITVEDQNQSTTSQCQGTTNSGLFQAQCTAQSNTQSLASTLLCGFPLKLGDTSQVVQSSCGKPAIIQQVQANDPSNANTLQIAELTYDGPPRVLFRFQDGKLKERLFI